MPAMAACTFFSRLRKMNPLGKGFCKRLARNSLGERMGVDVNFLVRRGNVCAIADLLVSLQNTYEEVENIWKNEFGKNYFDYMKKFSKTYSNNWRIDYACYGDCGIVGFEGPPQEESFYLLEGPWSFSAYVFGDSVLFEHVARWVAFKNDINCQQRLISSATIFARALESSQIIFLPDSMYEGTGCVDSLLDGKSIDDVVSCLNGSGLVRIPSDRSMEMLLFTGDNE